MSVREGGSNLDLALKTHTANRRGEFDPQYLDGHRTPVSLIVREIYRSHAPASDDAVDIVATIQRFADSLKF
jgi:hypothetical protein